MRQLSPVPYRALLLASVAAVAIAGRGAAQTISTSVTGPVSVIAGTSLSITPTGSILSSGANDAVVVGSQGPSLSNSGLIQASGTGYGLHVTTGGSLDFVTNIGTIAQTGGGVSPALQIDAGGIIGTLNNLSTGSIGAAGNIGVNVLGQLGTLTNSGTIGDTSASAGIYLGSNATVTSIVNNAGGQILSGSYYGVGVRIGGMAGGVTNEVGGTIAVTGVASYGVYVSGSVTNLSNAGLLQANGGIGIGLLLQSGSIGTLSNAGTILANGYGGFGIGLNGGTISALTNTGQIQTNGDYGVGIGVGTYRGSFRRRGSSLIGSLTNGGTIQANGYAGVGIGLQYGTIAALTNTGLIQANGNYGQGIGLGAYVGKRYAGGYSTIGSLTNAGTIQANGVDGVGINVQTGRIATLTNTGLIQANGYLGRGIAVGFDRYRINYRSNSSIGVLTNSGTIEANGTFAGFGVIVGGGTIGVLNNTGLIQANSAIGEGFGVAVAYGGIGTLFNAGTIVGSTAGIFVIGGTIGSMTNAAGGTISGGLYGIAIGGTFGTIVNSGKIVATDPNGVAIKTLSYGLYGSTAGIVNTAGGVIQGGTLAIDNSGDTNPLAIVNAGQIVGDIKLGQGADSIVIEGAGTVAGNIIGQSGSGQMVVFNTTVPYALDNVIDGVDNITVQGGTLAIQQFGSVTTPILNALAFNIGSGGTVRLNNGTVQATSFVNQGLLDIGTGTPTIAGALTQTATGRLGVTVTGTGSGKLTVSGVATVAGGILVNAPTAAAQAVTLFGQTFTIVTAGSLVATIVGSTTDATTPNQALVFTIGQNGNDLTLTGKANPIANLLPFTGDFNRAQVEFGLTGLANLLLSSNDLINYAKVIAPFINGTFSSSQQLSLLTRLEASLIGSNQVSLSSILSIEGAATDALTDRQTAALQIGGISAGDEVGRGYQVWVQPFGSLQTQNATGGLDGSSSNSYGAVMGADTLVRPDLRVGLALTIGNTDISYNGNLAGNTGRILSTQLALYATWNQGQWFVTGTAGGGINWYTSHEAIPILGGSRDAGYNGTHLTVRVGTGYAWLVNSRLTVTPFAAIQDTHFNIGGYSTHGLGIWDLTVSNKAFDSMQSRIGAKVAYTFEQAGYNFTPELHSYYLHNFGADLRLSTTEAFVGGGPVFTTIGPARDRDVWNVGFGLKMAKIGRVTLTGNYDYLAGATSHDQQFSARFATEF